MVELLAIKKNFTLRVDRGVARSIINEGSKDFLKLSTPLYLGGLPVESAQHAYKQWHLRNLTSFRGCMKEVWINHKLVDFFNAAKQQKVTPGCSLVENENDTEMEDEFVQEPPEVKEVGQCKLDLELILIYIFFVYFNNRLILAIITCADAAVNACPIIRAVIHVNVNRVQRENIVIKVRQYFRKRWKKSLKIPSAY
jgi:hypothetical protein